MKSQKGITLTSLVIYITIVLIVVGILAVISGTLQGNIKEIYAEGTNNAEIDKFNVYFLKEVKKQGNAIDKDKPVSTNEVYFTTGNRYKYNSNDKCIYLNDTIKVAENIEICEFDRDLVNDKTVITVKIKAINGEEKSIEYVLNNNYYSQTYENEEDYIDKVNEIESNTINNI